MSKNHIPENYPLSFQKKVWIASGIVSLFVIIILLLKQLFGLLLLILAGILLAIFFHGCASILNKLLHLPKKIALPVAVTLNLLLLVAFFWFVGARLQQQVSELSDTLPKSIESGKKWLQNTPGGDRIVSYINNSGDSGKTVGFVKKFFSSTFGILSDFYIIFLLGMFFTASPKLYRDGFIKLLPDRAKQSGRHVLGELYTVLKNWIKGLLFGFIFIALLSALGLWAIGIPLILTLALIAGLMNFVPNFGPIIALVPACLIALTIEPSLALWVIGVYTGIQIVQSAVSQPLIQKKMLSMPPALVIFGQVALGGLAGFWGVLLATPIIAIIMTLINKLYVERHSEDSC